MTGKLTLETLRLRIARLLRSRLHPALRQGVITLWGSLREENSSARFIKEYTAEASSEKFLRGLADVGNRINIGDRVNTSVAHCSREHSIRLELSISEILQSITVKQANQSARVVH